MNATEVRGLNIDLNALTGRQDPKHTLDEYVRLDLPPVLTDTVVYSKLEGGIADTVHDPKFPWMEQFVGIRENYEPGSRNIASPAKGKDPPEQGIPEHAGLIFTFHGTPGGRVAIDQNTKDMLTEEQAQLREDTFNTTYPRFTKWDFRIHEIVRTNGPELRSRLYQSSEERRASAEQSALASQEKLFVKLFEMIEKRGGKVTDEAKEAAGVMTTEKIAASIGVAPDELARWQQDAAESLAKEPPETMEIQARRGPGRPRKEAATP